MPDTLSVDVNREELHGLEVPNSFETTGSFAIELNNHGESLHVHLHLDDDLSAVASLEATNHHVESNGTRRVEVAVKPGASVRGKLKVVTAYGATTRYIDVILTEPEEQEDRVQVDESLSKPQPKPPERNRAATPSSGSNPLTDRPELAVLGLGAVALVVAAYAALVLNNTVVVLGALAVLAGVLVAVYILLQ